MTNLRNVHGNLRKASGNSEKNPENGIDPFKWLQKYSQALFKHMTAKGLSQVWKETGQRKNKFSIRLPEKLEEADKKINKYLPEKLAEDFDMQPWLDSIFRA
ncbi:hypothetical protein [Parasutterella excrementihominis]|uniref:hypothetical protein n=1 Tax=Parasutterella excrementihominis TaxID=487175 RepID=UPI003AB53548